MRADQGEFGTSAREEPLTYPGRVPGISYLYFGDSFFQIEVADGRRLGQSWVVWDDEDPLQRAGRHRRERLNNALLRLNAADIDTRSPVLAYGSNASPAQLRSKFAEQGVSSAIPVVRCEVRNLDIVYSSHLAPYGAVPATIMDSPDTTIRVHVMFVDADQLEILDASEKNYSRTLFDGSEFPLTIERGEQLTRFHVYVSNRGVMRFEDGRARRLESQSAARPEHSQVSQVDAVRNALRLLVDHRSAPQFLQDIAAGNVDVEALNERLADIGALPAGVSSLGRRDAQYQDLDFFIPADSGGLVVRRNTLVTASSGRPAGDFIVVVHPDDARSRSLGRSCAVRLLPLRDATPCLSIAARVARNETVRRGEVLVDQMVRDAAGIEVGEVVTLEGVSLPTSRVADALIGRRYALLRVQSADGILVERSACFVPKPALGVLGIESGDKVVVESVEKSEAHQLVLRAFELPEDVEQRRQTLEGRPNARFPACSELLGVSPDLPWIFLDADARSALGGLPKCAAVRVRAARGYQLTKALREYIFVIVVALLGALSVFRSRDVSLVGVHVPSDVLALFIVVAISLFLVFVGVRGRLE